jgi:hypothetical protein
MNKNEMTASAPRLVGDAMLDCIQNLIATSNADCSVATATDKALACGYVKDNGKPDFIAFYEALLEAKGMLSGSLDDDSDEQMSEIEAMLRDRYCDEAVDAYIELFGEDYLNHFEDVYQGEFQSGADFARDMIEGCYNPNLPHFVEIDWEATWQNLSYDYCEQDGFIFSNNW